jgi:hypothetical protein
MALNPAPAWWHPQGVAGSVKEVARFARWVSAEQPARWIPLARTFRDGSMHGCWAMEIVAGPYGPGKAERAVVAPTDPVTLPDLTTWYLLTNLPAPSNCVETSQFPPADLTEIVWQNAVTHLGPAALQTGQTSSRLVPVSGA